VRGVTDSLTILRAAGDPARERARARAGARERERGGCTDWHLGHEDLCLVNTGRCHPGRSADLWRRLTRRWLSAARAGWIRRWH